MPSVPYIPGGTVPLKFTTRAFATGAPTTLSGSPVVSIYKDGSTTESVAGVTLTVDFDSRTGLNHVAVDTSADGTFYSAGGRFFAVITTGTVGGTSVVGEVVGEFDLATGATTVPTLAQIAAAVWQDTTAGDFTTASSIGKSLYTAGVVPGAANGLFIAGSNAATAVNFTGNITGTVSTVTTVTNQLTAAQIATGVWQDATAGDFTTASSIGKALYIANVAPGAAGGHFIAGANAATSITTALTANIVGNITGNLSGSVGSVTGLTTALIATAVWQDTTAGDFTVNTSPGKIIFTQLGGAFTTTSSSVFSTASLVNAPTGGSAPTTAQIATAVWQDLTAGSDFGTAGSIGALLKLDIDAAISSRSTYAGGAVASVTAGVTVTTNNDKTGYSLLLTQALSAARLLDAIADTSMTLNDAMHCAIAAAVGQRDASAGTTMTVKTVSTGTLLHTYTITTIAAPSTVPEKIV